ncbi:zinc finger SWIM domain-containing protein 8-like isoform X2 [Pomacea canaliculata]|uniref:zinc finger SWIM domain-containing protein 8-like isoform X2 n=1 Tax=Pomacea canaliculata TaxID=400727 RepID=UPI000D739F23|nr:zinc finger SWIM domain-containing protein 8-like isoform X2 [Pomacea canaliculata]
MDLMFEWEYEGDRFSFEDSDRFEEDSLCSWGSEPELCNNWRGWKRQNGGQSLLQIFPSSDDRVMPLVELAAQAVACNIPFEEVERFAQPIPEQLQLRIAFWSFPENEEDIRLYSCLANGSADEFTKGEHLYKTRAVKDALQIGFHLSATVVAPQNFNQVQGKGSFNVAVVFDRRRISSCSCSCNSAASWCSHIVALCLFRIHQGSSVTLRAPVSESLSQLKRDQLQKFAQYLISELPQQILPTAQRLLDELLSCKETAMNTVGGAPDPTAGPSANEQTSWCLDEATLHENIKKTLVKFCVPSPIVFSDVNYLSASAPPAAAEWQSLLRPLRGREPEGMWNLLSIVREMFRRTDSNSIPLLEILTDEVLQCEQILIWWFVTKASTNNNNNLHVSRGNNSSASATQHAAASLCEEIVALWRLAALNPRLSPVQRQDLCAKFRDWHISTVEKVRKARNSTSGNSSNNVKKTDMENFSGFKPAIEACQLTWEDYPIPGVTYSSKDGQRWHYRFSSKFHDGGDVKKPSRVQPVTVCSEDIISTDNSRNLAQAQRSHELRSRAGRIEARGAAVRRDSCVNDGAASSGSEGFCESENRRSHDSDSSCDNPKGFHSRSNSLDESEVMLADAAAVNCQELSPGSQDHQDAEVFDENADGGSAVAKTSSPVAVVGQALQASGAKAQDLIAAPHPPDLSAKDSSQSLVAGSRASHEPSSESQQSSDEYQLYFYDTKVKVGDIEKRKKDKTDEPNLFSGLKKMENVQDILFARAEALHAHGHTKEACHLARQLAEEMLNSPPDLFANTVSSGVSTPKSKKKKALNTISLLASTTLAKASFLCSVLSEDTDCHYLAFKIGMFGMELARPPASCKALEVKLAYQESELLQLLKKIPLGPQEMATLRSRAEQLRDGTFQSRGDALLPLTLATFIFDSLCLPSASINDEKLGFEAAVTALGLKANISEAEHPLLCESTRRQRGDLAIAMLVHYKDDIAKLSKIMDKLLDKEVNTHYKAPSLVTYLSTRTTAVSGSHSHPTASASSSSASSMHHLESSSSAGLTLSPSSLAANSPSSLRAQHLAGGHHSAFASDRILNGGGNNQAESLNSLGVCGSGLSAPSLSSSTALNGLLGNGGARPKTTYSISGKDTDSSALEEEGDDLKAMEAKIRCLGMKKKPSQGMASIDSSAPETTSSDNSPTLVRRNFAKHQGPGSDSGSSGESDSLGSSSSGDKAACNAHRDNESPPTPYVARILPQQLLIDNRMSSTGIKGLRYKGKTRIMPTVPNQPSEASAHFMFELAKTVLLKAGGSSATSLFTQPSSSTPHAGPHRHLHLCAFQIGLYALGLSNCVSPNWLSRTYSSHVSWIAGQAMEIGSAAVRIIIDTWEGHLTPPEVASLADRASRGRDPTMVRVAAELALSCLPHAHALNPTEVQRALYQCREQSWDMLERACLAVEQAAAGGGVFPEVLFEVARHWYEMSEETSPTTALLDAQGSNRAQPGSVTQRHDLDNSPVMGVATSATVTQSSSLPIVERSSPVSIGTVHYTQAAAVAVAAAGMVSQAQVTSSPQLLTSGPVAQAVVLPYTHALPPQGGPPAQLQPSAYLPPAAYNYVQQVAPGTFHQHSYSQHHLPLHSHGLHAAYVTSYAPYPTQATFAASPMQGLAAGPGGQLYHTSAAPPHLRQVASTVPAAVQVYSPSCQVSSHSLATPAAPTVAHIHAIHSMDNGSNPGNSPANSGQVPVLNISMQPSTANTPGQLKYLTAAFRVGMLAMETLARRVHDDRPQTKYARNPPYGEDVKWLLGIAIKLGSAYLQQFCAGAVNAVVSPFVLYDLAMEAAHVMARNNPVHVSNQLRSNILNPLFQKCLQMFIQCAHQRIHHISNADYDEFVSIVCTARNAFYLAPGGLVQFNELLQSLRRSKSCRKDLWQRIVSGLATGSV